MPIRPSFVKSSVAGASRYALAAVVMAWAFGSTPPSARAAAPDAGEGASLKFAKLGADPATGMAVAEDGALLFTAHADANRVRAWDVRTGKQVADAAVPGGPSFVLQRGNELFVACPDAGEVAVLTRAKGWAVDRRLRVGTPLPSYLSAPAGKAFARRLLVTCPGRAGDMVVDLPTAAGGGQPKVVANLTGAIATVAAGGEFVFEQPFQLGGFGTRRPYADLLAGRSSWSKTVTLEGQPGTTEIRQQVKAGDPWYGGNVPMRLDLDGANGGGVGCVIVPDLLRDVAYPLWSDAATAGPVRRPGGIVGRRSTEIPPELAGYLTPATSPPSVPKPLSPVARTADGRLAPMAPAVAVTLGDRLYVFLYASAERAAYRAETAAFGEPDAPNLPPKPQDRDLPADLDAVAQVEVAGPVLAYTTSEDGKTLVAAREGMLLAWDVVTGKLTKRLPFPYGNCLLWRRNTLYVGDMRSNLVQTFDPGQNWQPGHAFKLGDGRQPNVLAAARGRAFDGKVLLLTHQNEVLRLDAAKRTAEPLYKRPQLGWLVAGAGADRVFEQEGGGGTGDGTPELFDYAPYVAGTVPAARSQRPFYGLGKLHQARPGPLWFDDKGVWAGKPIASLSGQQGMGTLIPDLTRDQFYAVGGGQVKTFKADVSLAEVGSRPARMPAEMRAVAAKGWAVANSTGPYSFSPPLAAVVGDRLHAWFRRPDGALFHYATRATADPSPAATAAATGPAGAFPARVVEGQPVRYTLPTAAPGATYAVIAGPAGLSVGADGAVAWTPAKGDGPAVAIKVRVDAGGKTYFVRLETTVVPADRAAAAVGAGAPQAGKHYLTNGPYDVAIAADGGSVLLLQDALLRRLDADGVAVVETRTLPASYRWVYERPGHYVAVRDDAVDLLDKRSLSVLRSARLDPPGAGAAAFHPTRGETYVSQPEQTADGPGDAPAVRVVDEAAGRATIVPRLAATALAVHPGGRLLYAAAPFRAFDPTTGRGDPAFSRALMVFDLDAKPWRLVGRRPNEAESMAPARFRVSPDGAAIAALPGFQDDQRRKAGVRVLSAADVGATARVAFEGSGITDVAFHPSIDLAATVSVLRAAADGRVDAGTVTLRSRQTGAVAERRLDAGGRTLGRVERAWFAPGGRHLMVAHVDEAGRRLLEAFPLRLEPAEERLIAVAPRRPAVVNPAVPGAAATLPAPAGAEVARGDLQALKAATTKVTGSKEIAAAYADSVVLVKTADGSGSGVVVGAAGLVLTSAHVLPDVGDVTVDYRAHDVGGHTVERSAAATVVRADRKRDLALLRVAGVGRLPPVHLAAADEVAMGEDVTVIGHPGVGRDILTHTVTSGIVSHPNRKPIDVRYLQTNAAINPGMSGGPVFDGEGALIGIVAKKAIRAEAVGLAVAVSEVRAFLEACSAGEKAQ
jgi:S1-C subfamily serine protease